MKEYSIIYQTTVFYNRAIIQLPNKSYTIITFGNNDSVIIEYENESTEEPIGHALNRYNLAKALRDQIKHPGVDIIKLLLQL